MSAIVQTRPLGKRQGAWYNAAACIGGILALLAIFLVPTIEPALIRAEHWAADWRTAWLSERLPSSHPKVAIVRIAEDSIAHLPYLLPINRGYFADVMDAVDKAGARVIGLDFYFTKDTEKNADDKLRNTLRRLKDKLVVGAFERRNTAQREYQYAFIGDAPAGYIDLQPEADHVIRYRAEPWSEGRYPDSFSSRLAKAGGWTGTKPPERIAWLLPPADEKAETFDRIDARDLLQATPEQNAERLKNRIVLIGADLFALDRHWTPLSIRSRRQTVGVEVHAQMVAELIDGNRSYRELGPQTRTAFLLVLAALGIALSLRFHERRFDFLDWRVVSLGVIAVDLLSFRFLHLVLPFTLAAIAWVAGVTTGTHFTRAIAWLRGRRSTA